MEELWASVSGGRGRGRKGGCRAGGRERSGLSTDTCTAADTVRMSEGSSNCCELENGCESAHDNGQK